MKAENGAGEPSTALAAPERARGLRGRGVALPEDAVTQGRCPGLVLIASDPFLGVLKSHPGNAAMRVLSATIPRDLTSFGGHDLARRVTEALDHVRH